MKKQILTITAALAIFLTGCGAKQADTKTQQAESNKPIASVTKKEVNPSKQAGADKYNTLSYTDYYAINGKAAPTVESPKPGEVVYGGLDKLGRPTYVIGNLNYDLISKEKGEDREDIKVDPIGWQKNSRVTIKEANGKTYNGYFYNRSHLLADSLGGAATKENLVTGTRTQNTGIGNTGGMAYTEEKARQFFAKKTDATMIYQATAIYQGDEVVPRYVKVDIKTSDGTIDEQVIVSNTATGFSIDYNTGKYVKN